MMPTFYHKRPWKYEVSYFSITKGVSHVKIRHLPFKTIHKTPGPIYINDFARPISKIARTNRKAISFKDCRYPHRSFSTITQTIKSNPVFINKWKCAEPFYGLFVL